MDQDEKESALYDRQVRLWGFEAQRKMQQSKVLFCGLSGLHFETAKNLILAGINVTISDSTELVEDDLNSIFYAQIEEVGQLKALVVQPRLQALNVYAKVEANTTPLDDLPDSYFSQFSCIIMTNCSEVAASASPLLPHPSLKSQALRVNALCHQESHDIQFLLSDCYGAEGWFILDFGKQFTFQHDPPRHHVIESFSYPSLQEIWNTKWATLERKHFPISFTYLRSRIISEFREQYHRSPSPADISIIQSISSTLLQQNNLSPELLSLQDIHDNVCLQSWSQMMILVSILGGFLSQEIVKAVSGVGVPMKNIFVFSLHDGIGKAFNTAT